MNARNTPCFYIVEWHKGYNSYATFYQNWRLNELVIVCREQGYTESIIWPTIMLTEDEVVGDIKGRYSRSFKETGIDFWSAKVYFVLQAAGFYIGDTRVYPNKDFVRFIERYESGEFSERDNLLV